MLVLIKTADRFGHIYIYISDKTNAAEPISSRLHL